MSGDKTPEEYQDYVDSLNSYRDIKNSLDYRSYAAEMRWVVFEAGVYTRIVDYINNKPANWTDDFYAMKNIFCLEIKL